ncbi:MAG TPA: cytochrome D1 domain-containing protein [Bryobacteraceae bacterium]|jgi:YVTN family beta-propeller protein|nr:cytochrome D1 domain-containing protein [Bryobacteraceae bacterium]
MATNKGAFLALTGLAAAGLIFAAGRVDPNNPTGTHGLIVIDKIGRHIRFLDPSTYQEISNLEVGVAPHDVAISPDHKTAYVPVYGDGVYGRNPHPGHTIAIIDLASRQVSGTIDVSPYQAPHGIQIDDAGTIYVTCDLSRKLLVIDPKKRSIEAALDTEGTGHWAAVLPDASKAYVVNKNDRLFVTVIDLKKRSIIARVPAPNGTEGIAASPDGKYVVAVDHSEPKLLVIDPATDTVEVTLPLQGNTKASFKPRFSPDGSKLLVCNMSERLVNIIDVSDPHGKQQVLTVGKDPMGFAFAPDGKTVLVANHGDGTVSVIDLSQNKVVSSFMGGAGVESLAYY